MKNEWFDEGAEVEDGEDEGAEAETEELNKYQRAFNHMKLWKSRGYK